MTTGDAPGIASTERLPASRWIRVKILTTAGAWLVIVLYVAQTFLPPNVIRLPYQDELKIPISSLAPQGWAFFTKAPREPRLSVFVLSEGDGGMSKVGPNGSIDYGWGLSRAFMLQQADAGRIASELSTDTWMECDDRATQVTCVAAATAADPVVVPMPSVHSLPCGEYVFAMTEAVPFAWREISDERERALSAVRVDLAC